MSTRMASRKKIRRGTALAARTASEPLHVMVEPDRMACYRAVVKATGMSLREWVTNALDTAVAQHQLIASELGEMPALPANSAIAMLGGHGVRLRRLETELEALRKYVSTMTMTGPSGGGGTP